jgi:hypothetical protein
MLLHAFIYGFDWRCLKVHFQQYFSYTGQFYQWSTQEYSEETTHLQQVNDKLYHTKLHHHWKMHDCIGRCNTICPKIVATSTSDLFVCFCFFFACVCVCFLLWNIFFLLLSILLSYKQVIEFVTKTCHCGFVTEMSFMISYNGFNDLHVWKKSSE